MINDSISHFIKLSTHQTFPKLAQHLISSCFIKTLAGNLIPFLGWRIVLLST